jgi:hypothetical protein
VKDWEDVREHMRNTLAHQLGGKASPTNLGLILGKVANIPSDRDAAQRDVGKIKLAVQLFIDEELAITVHDSLRTILAEALDG